MMLKRLNKTLTKKMLVMGGFAAVGFGLAFAHEAIMTKLDRMVYSEISDTLDIAVDAVALWESSNDTADLKPVIEAAQRGVSAGMSLMTVVSAVDRSQIQLPALFQDFYSAAPNYELYTYLNSLQTVRNDIEPTLLGLNDQQQATVASCLTRLTDDTWAKTNPVIEYHLPKLGLERRACSDLPI